MFILVVALLSLVTMQITGIKGNSTASQISNASNWGSNQIEAIFGMAYDDANLVDKGTIGTAGLNSTTAATADGTAVSPDGLYTAWWNVADDVPMDNLKTIRVIINRNDQGQTKAITMDYVKAKFQ
jgi:Tfp pilus assembly protein PilV